MTRHKLDARRLLCPMPVIRVQQRIAGLVPGDILEVAATDPGAGNDVPAWCKIHGHKVLAIYREPHEISIVIEVR